MIRSVRLGADRASELAAFTRVACAYDLLTTTSVERAIFDDPDPQLVAGYYDGALDAVGVAVVRGERGFVKFLAVHPRSRRRGLGSDMLGELEAFCVSAGATSMSLGTSAPRYVVPGVDARSTETTCFFEARGYARAGEAVNLTVLLTDLDEPPGDVDDAGPDELEHVRPWVSEHHPNWIAELEAAVRIGACVVVRDEAFACYDVNREGWFGPTATHPDLRGRGLGTAVLLGALHRLRARGHSRAEIAWANALAFYSKAVGARVSRVFWWYGKRV